MLLVSGIYPPDTGGPATFTQDFSRWLSQKNLDVSIVTYTDGSSTTSIVDGVRIFQIHRDKNIVKRYFKFISVLVKNYNSSTKVLAAGAFLEIMTASVIRLASCDNKYVHANVEQEKSDILSSVFQK